MKISARSITLFGLTAFSLLNGPAVFGEKATAAKTATTGTGASAHALAPEVTLDEFKKHVDAKTATIVDANGADMYANGHVPGAISFAAHQGKMDQVLPKDKKALIIAYCGGPMCTAWEFAAQEAQKLGYTNIKHYKGGIKGWKDAKLPLATGANRT